MAMVLLGCSRPKIGRFWQKNLFLYQILSILNSLVQIRDQGPEIDRCRSNSAKLAKGEGSRTSTSTDTLNCLMASYSSHSDDFMKHFSAFCHLATGGLRSPNGQIISYRFRNVYSTTVQTS